MANYVLHYAPDNASLVIRMILEELGVAYETRLVDRRIQAQRSDGYRRLNPVGRIPALETPSGPMFETAAIALWLADRHGALVPRIDAPERGQFLSWLFFLSNSLHAELRTLFYPATVAGPDAATQSAVSAACRGKIADYLDLLETACHAKQTFGSDTPTICDLYLGPLLRWPALYPRDSDRAWYNLQAWPALFDLMCRIETRPSAQAASRAEGLGPRPFSEPQPPNPPEGHAI